MINFYLPTMTHKMTQTKRLFFLVLYLAVGQVLIAQTTYSTIRNGFWNAASSWDANGIPPNPIPADATVELNHQIFEPTIGAIPKTNYGTVNVNKGFSMYADWDNFGTIQVRGNPDFPGNVMSIYSTFNNKAGGALKTNVGKGFIYLWSNAILNNETGAMIKIADEGFLQLAFGSTSTLNNAGTMDNEGSVTIYSEFNNQAGGVWTNGRVAIINGATVTNAGQIKLRRTPASDFFNLQGNFTSVAGSSVEWVLSASGTASVDYPLFSNSKTAAVFSSSTLAVSLDNGFEPNIGDVFDIYFGQVPTNPISLPALSPGKIWRESRGGGRIRLQVETPPIPAAALDFDGQNDVVQVNGIGPGDNNFTIEAWFKEEGGTQYENIVAWLGNRDGRRQQILFGTQPNGTLRYGNFDYSTFRFDAISGTTNVRDGNWHHVAVTTRNGSDLALYVDGQLEASGTADILNTVEDFVNTIRIGAQGVPGLDPVTEHFTGKIDEVRIWSRALCADEIQNNYACELDGNEQGLLAYYQFNEGIASRFNPGVKYRSRCKWKWLYRLSV